MVVTILLLRRLPFRRLLFIFYLHFAVCWVKVWWNSIRLWAITCPAYPINFRPSCRGNVSTNHCNTPCKLLI